MCSASVIFQSSVWRLDGTYPIAESETVMGGSTAQVDNETSDNEADNCGDLDRSEPELAFTEGAGAQQINDDDYDTSDGDPCSAVDLGVPVYERYWYSPRVTEPLTSREATYK